MLSFCAAMHSFFVVCQLTCITMCNVNTVSVRRFFQSKLEDFGLKAKGTYELKVQNQRRKNRINSVVDVLTTICIPMLMYTHNNNIIHYHLSCST